MICLHISGCFCDLCKKLTEATEEVTEDEIGLHIHKTAVPHGKMKAGVFEQDTNANTSAECVMSCCDNHLCNVAFYTQRKCYTIECDPENPQACAPIKQPGTKFNDTLMVTVRSLGKCSFTEIQIRFYA